MRFRVSRKLAVGIVASLVAASVASVVLVNLRSITQTVGYLSRFSIEELLVLRTSLRSSQPDSLSSDMLILRMRADPGAIREAPHPNSAIVSTVPAGTPFRALSETRTWYLVELRDDADRTSFGRGHVSVSDVQWTANCDAPHVGELTPGDRFRDCVAAPEMVVLPAGSFVMGSPASEAHRLPHEGPRRTIEIAAPFAVGVYEVTFEQWEACRRTGGCDPQLPNDLGLGRGSYPVMNVNWSQARDYVRWLSDLTGERYRLPSEAEWEYAARAGGAFSLPESETAYCEHLNGLDRTAMKLLPDVAYAVDSNLPCSDGHLSSAVVGSFPPNAFGLYDTLGNVSEWTQDCYHASYLGGPTDGTSRETGETEECRFRVSRGGSWAYSFDGIRPASRIPRSAGSSYSSLGFRVARDLVQGKE